jgi:hypothetical protein
MAGPLDTGQEFSTYLLFLLIMIMIYQLVFLAIPEDPKLLCILAKTLVKTTAWRLRGHPWVVRPKKTKCFKKLRKKLKDQKNPRHDDQKAPQLHRTGILCRHKGWLLH